MQPSGPAATRLVVSVLGGALWSPWCRLSVIQVVVTLNSCFTFHPKSFVNSNWLVRVSSLSTVMPYATRWCLLSTASRVPGFGHMKQDGCETVWVGGSRLHYRCLIWGIWVFLSNHPSSLSKRCTLLSLALKMQVDRWILIWCVVSIFYGVFV